MASIRTGIELQDSFSSIFYNIVATVNYGVSAMEEMQATMNSGVDTSSIEGARMAVGELNAAMQDMQSPTINVSDANNGYLRLSQTVNDTERCIQDNVEEQESFNKTIQQGTNGANGLTSIIKGAAAAYDTIQSVGSIINISDELTQSAARLNMMNDGLQTTKDLQNMIYLASQDARGEYQSMVDTVAKLGNNAGDAFGSTAEIIDFAELVQKQFTIAGASAAESSNAMLQLTQALGSGVLRGDELNSIFEQAPNLIQNIADYLDAPIGSVREMASEGELTADIVKNAMFAATDEINANFESMPMTFAQIWQGFQNTALMAFEPVLTRLNDLANSDAFNTFVENACETLATVANVVLSIFDLVASVGTFVSSNWSIIAPIVYGVVAAFALYAAYLVVTKIIEMAMCVASYAHAAATGAEASATAAATAAQYGFNTALLSSPITWIIILIIALIAIIFAVVAAINQATGYSISAIGIICGAIAIAGAIIWNIFVGLVNAIIGIGVEIYNLIAAFANFFANVFNDPVGAVINLFSKMFDFILGIVQSAAKLIDTVLGSDLAGAVNGFRNNFAASVADVVGDQAIVMETLNASDFQFAGLDYGDAFNAGYSFGEGIEDTISNFSLDNLFGSTDIPSPEDYASNFDYGGAGDYGIDDISNGLGNISNGVGDIASDTGAIKDSLEISEETLKYLRDIAEQETINRYTTAEITIEQTNHNNVSSDMDLDGLVEGLTSVVNEAVDMIAEGVHA